MKKSIIIFSFLALFLLKTNAQIPAGYYNSAQGLTGAALKTALHNIIKNHTTVSYNSLLTHFQTTDKKPNGKVWDIYSEIPGGTPPYEFTFSNSCGNYAGEGDCYNREHSWPQSWFGSVAGPYSDLFHMYPTDGYVNGRRGNYPYGDVDSAYWTSLNGGKLGFCSDPGYSGAAFEPIDEYKGDLARSYFYMSTRYESEDASWTTSAGTNKSTLLPWQADVLIHWSQQDIVSAKEIARNNAIYQIQHNRNPYIDNPNWVDSIWTITFTGIEKYKNDESSVQVYPNPARDQFKLSNSGRTDISAEIHIYSVIGEEIQHIEAVKFGRNNESEYKIDCTNWSQGIYFITIIEAKKFKVVKFIKE